MAILSPHCTRGSRRSCGMCSYKWRVPEGAGLPQGVNAAVLGLSYGSASFVFHSVIRMDATVAAIAGLMHTHALILAVAACGVSSGH